eukprot:3990208-Pyramimonas_sp.AAC.1
MFHGRAFYLISFLVRGSLWGLQWNGYAGAFHPLAVCFHRLVLLFGERCSPPCGGPACASATACA